MGFGLGFDTGGTNTDAVLMDLTEDRILAKAKSPTVHGDLCIGIRGVLEAFDPEMLPKVSVVSLSSTLATNSVVEDKSCRVALICIGQDYDNSMPVDHYTRISGGHNGHGAEECELDIATAAEFLDSLRDRVDAIAISGLFSIRNPDHEERIRDMARKILDVPAVCGHDLSSSLGFSTRVSTCIMNARLVPVMENLISSVKKTLSEFGISAPLMIVRGNGSMMSESMALAKPVETILSGPSASMMGAMKLTGLRDAIVMDMGGTTTDMGILRNGKPKVSSEGMVIGGKPTHIVAAKVVTAGLGGDSRIYVNGREIVLGSRRSIPVCVAAQRWPEIVEHIDKSTRSVFESFKTTRNHEFILLDSEFFTLSRDPAPGENMTPEDLRFLELIRDHPYTVTEAAKVLGVYSSTINATWLEGRGIIHRIALTPTDVLHAMGVFTAFDADASKAAVAYLAKRSGRTVEQFLEDARVAIRSKICTELMRALMVEESGSDELGKAGEDMLRKIVTGDGGLDFGCRVRLNKPVIGIGAPSGVYTRWISEVMDAEVVVQPDADVGNAVGAISASMSESVSVLVRPEDLDDEASQFEIFAYDGRHLAETIEQAVEFSRRICSDHLTGIMKANGACDIVIEETVKEEYLRGDHRDILSRMNITFTAVGKPSAFSD